MKIYNTLTRQKEEFKPKDENNVKVYYCGPTPYNYAHIWNLKTYCCHDIIVKTLKFMWYKTKTVMNITDIDDKTIRDSKNSWKSLLEFTEFYTEHFLIDLEKLNITKADIVDPISNLIPEMVRMINTMIRRWYAYISEDNSIYFKISKFKSYWELANLDMSWMKESVRIDNDEYEKDSASDFALWKAYDPDSDWDNYWEWDFITDKSKDEKTIIKGRPGWHIECSACNMKHLGQEIDLHMWWIDNLFPHHQNEVAQTEACTWKVFSRYWMHHWHLTVDSKKMSKSAWNFYTLRDLEEKFSEISKSVLYRWIRLNFINWIYRESIDLSFNKLEANFNTIDRIDNVFKSFKNYEPKFDWVRDTFRQAMQIFVWDYIKALEDDINMPEALAVVFDFHKFVNTELSAWNLSKEELDSIKDMFKTYDQVLSIYDFSILENDLEIPEEVLELAKSRDEARLNKDYELSDKYRDEIIAKWYKVRDSEKWTIIE